MLCSVSPGHRDVRPVRAGKSLANKFSGFARNNDGNIAIMFGFTALLLFGFVGAAVDYTRFNDVKSDIIESIDAAALAVTRYEESNPDLSEEQLKDYGRRFFFENFRYEDLVDNLTVDFTITSAKVITEVTGTMKTTMLGVDFFDDFDMHTTNEIAKPGSGQVEIALVLDVTGSMSNYAGGDKKIESLRTAVDELLDVIDEPLENDEARVAIVPFNAYVNPGGASAWVDTWGDLNAEALYHGVRFFHVEDDGDIDMDRRVNHYHLFDSVPNTDWMGCVEARPYPLDELDIPPTTAASSAEITDAIDVPEDLDDPSGDDQTRMADAFEDAPDVVAGMSDLTNAKNTRWVPLFVSDEPDCNSTNECEYGRSGWVNGLNWHGYWYDDPDRDDQYTDHEEDNYYNRYFINDREYTRDNQGTPFEKYVPIVHHFREVLQGDIDDEPFEDFLDFITAYDYGDHEYILRNSYVGWWDPSTETYRYKYDQNPSIDETISDTDDDMRGPNRDCPAPILPLTNVRDDIEDHMDTLFPNGNTNSANGAVWGWRVLSPEAPFTEGESYDNDEWQKAVVIMTDGNNTTSNRRTHWGSSLTAYGYEIESRMGVGLDDDDDMEEELDNKLLRVCHRMKEQGILIYSIVFGLNNEDTEQVFKSCATGSEEPYYYKAPSGEDLEEAFGEIAQNLQNLHISR